MAKCVFCIQRKGNRFCIALKGEICSLCCGENRQKKIECLQECIYLKAGQKFEEDKLISGKHWGDEFTDKYADILQNIEFAILNTAKKRGDVLDYNVKEALQEAIRYYHSLDTNKKYIIPVMPDNIREIYESIISILEWRETKLSAIIKSSVRELSYEEIIRCFQRIIGSIDFHSGGFKKSTNYLNFTACFIK